MDDNQNKKPDLTPAPQYQYDDDEIDLVDIVKVLWIQRWFIAVLTVLICGIMTVYVFVRTPLYEISAQISPGITGLDKDGEAVKNILPNDIVAWFSGEGYAELFENSSGPLPSIKANIVSNSNSVKIIYFHEKPAEGVLELNNILNKLKDGKTSYFFQELKLGKASLEKRINDIEQEIKSLKIEQEVLNKIDHFKLTQKIAQIKDTITLLNAKIDAIRKNKANVQQKMEYSEDNINKLNKSTEEFMQRREQLAMKDSDKITLLMYSNIIQQNISYADNLQNQIFKLNVRMNKLDEEENSLLKDVVANKTLVNEMKIDRDEMLSLSKQEIDIKIENRIIEIDALKMKLHNLATIDIIKPPVSSLKPLKPEKVKLLILALLIGLILSVLVSFLRSFWLHNKSKIMNNAYNKVSDNE